MNTAIDKKTAPQISIGSLCLNEQRLVFILGPCVMESEEFTWKMAQELKNIGRELQIDIVFKASYDKANRSSHKSFRGIGCERGCQLLGQIAHDLEILVTTDVHTPQEAHMAAEYVDLLQIPAFLCRQTDLLQAAAETGKCINVKKGQFMAPWDVANIAEKLRHFGNENFLFTERGVSFGYHNLVADMRSLYWMRQQGVKVIFDATHSVQRPGGEGERSGGDGKLAPILARAAVAAGCDGVFIETHFNPDEALSDGPNQIPLAELPQVLKTLQSLHHVLAETNA